MKKGDLVYHKKSNKPSVIISVGDKNPRTGANVYRSDIVWAFWEEYHTYGYMPIRDVTVLERRVFTDEEYQEIFV